MLMLATSPGETVERALVFAQGLFNADCAAFYRIDGKLQPFDYALRDVSPDFHRNYVEHMARHDPLQVRNMVAQAATVGQIDAGALGRDCNPYGFFLGAFGLAAAVELLFRDERSAHGGMCLMWRNAPPDTGEVQRIAGAVQDYLEFTLRPPKSGADRFGLTSREVEVAELLRCGRTNPEIAALLGIGVATVKTHLINMYTKLGVETRAAAVGLLAVS